MYRLTKLVEIQILNNAGMYETRDRWWEDLALMLIYDKNQLARLSNKNIDMKQQ